MARQELDDGHAAAHHLHVRVDVEYLREDLVLVEPVDHHLAADRAWRRCRTDAVIAQEPSVHARMRRLARTGFSTEALRHHARHHVALVRIDRLAHLGQGLHGDTCQ